MCSARVALAKTHSPDSYSHDLAVARPARRAARRSTRREASIAMQLFDVERARLTAITSSCVTPAPVFAGLERPHDRMRRRVKVPRRMLVLRGVAAPDVAAGQADAQMHPRAPMRRHSSQPRALGRIGSIPARWAQVPLRGYQGDRPRPDRGLCAVSGSRPVTSSSGWPPARHSRRSDGRGLPFDLRWPVEYVRSTSANSCTTLSSSSTTTWSAPFALDRGRIRRIPRPDDDARRRRERAGHGDNPLRRRRVVVGDDDGFGALDAGELAACAGGRNRRAAPAAPAPPPRCAPPGLSVVMTNGTRDPCSTRTSCRAASP